MALVPNKYNRHEIVFAKVTGYAPWPAFINQIDGDYAEVQFNSPKREM